MMKYTVLLVDDEENILKSLSRVFQEEGYDVITSESGEKGLDLLSEYDVDLVISDQMMPGMRGLDFLEKTIEKYPDLIRIILTGYAELSDALRAINDGCVYKFILKPWQNDDLKVTVRRALEQRDLIRMNNELSLEIKKRDKVLTDLEKQYPGITERPADGIYVIKSDTDRE